MSRVELALGFDNIAQLLRVILKATIGSATKKQLSMGCDIFELKLSFYLGQVLRTKQPY